MDSHKNLPNTNDRDSVLEISDFEPLFLCYFEMKIPTNLKPKPYTLPTSKEDKNKLLTGLESPDEIIAFFKKGKTEQAYLEKMSLRTLPESKNWCIEDLKVSSKFDQYREMTNQELKESKHDLRKLIKIHWLSNGIGAEHVTRGIPNIEEIPNEVYQIGIQSTSTKDYFKYVSTEENRKVGIRFKLWFQYEANNEERLEEKARFFKAFERFEEQIKSYVETMSFYFDELGHKEMELKLKNNLLIERQESRQHPSLTFGFNEMYEEIKDAVR
jgi:hypothetical protein